MKKISQSTMDPITSYMDDDIREQVCRELAPCEPEEFLKRYCELVPDFEEFLENEFSIFLEEDEGKLVCESESDEEFTEEELSAIEKHQEVRRLAKCGPFAETFWRNYARVPKKLIGKLAAPELATLVDAFRECYQDGKNSDK